VLCPLSQIDQEAHDSELYPQLHFASIFIITKTSIETEKDIYSTQESEKNV